MHARAIRGFCPLLLRFSNGLRLGNLQQFRDAKVARLAVLVRFLAFGLALFTPSQCPGIRTLHDGIDALLYHEISMLDLPDLS